MAHTLIHLSPPLVWTGPAAPEAGARNALWARFCTSFQERIKQSQAQNVGLGLVVGFPSSLRPGFDALETACREGNLEVAQDTLRLLRRHWGVSSAPHSSVDDLVQGLALTREVSPSLNRRLLDGLAAELAGGLAQAAGIARLERDKLRLGRPPHEAAWIMAETQEDRPSTLVKLAESWNPERCEYWRSDLGLYTADPAILPQARILNKIDFGTAKELARLQSLRPDAEVLEHLEKCGVSLRLCGALPPAGQDSADLGTLIEPVSDVAQQVHAVVLQGKLTLLSLDSEEMWRKPGFLAKFFAALSSEGLSIDLLATSQTNVSLTLDPNTTVTEGQLRRLEAQLGTVVHVVPQCAAVTLVGRRLRSMLPRLGPALEVFDEQKIHLVVQASSDISLTFVVDEDQAERLLRSLHQLLFVEEATHPNLGPSWQQLYAPVPESGQSGESQLAVVDEWWVHKRGDLLALAAGGGDVNNLFGRATQTPLYVYDAETISERAEHLAALPGVDRLFYAIKANSYPPILDLLWKRGLGLECVSPGELERVSAVAGDEQDRERILYTPNFAPCSDYELGLSRNCWTTLDSLAPLQQWPEVFRGHEVFLRLDPGKGAGHHRHVQTGGKMSKFGISLDQLEELLTLLKDLNVSVKGLHCHVGSGILDANNWFRNACFLAETASTNFPQVEVLDLGGGLGIPDRPGRPRLDLAQVGRYLDGFRKLYPQYKVWLEPGRYLVAESGVLLARVTQIKRKGERYYIGTDAGMHNLIRPALYGAYHHIVNLTRWGQAPSWRADIVGPICETGDLLGRDRWLPPTEPGDILLVATAGAYGRVMSSEYNLRPFAQEVLLESKRPKS